MSNKVGLTWLKDIPKANQDQFKEDLGSFKNGPIFNKLRSILSDEEDRLSRQRLSVEIFDSPNWANKQAFVNGQLSAIRLIKELIG